VQNDLTICIKNSNGVRRLSTNFDNFIIC